VPVPLPGTKPKPSPVTSATTPATPASGTMLYVLINGLNVRTKPELKAKSLGKLKLNDQVYFLNEVTGGTQTVRLQDKTEVTKPWFKIKTKRGTVGWVHGSGVDFYKRKPQDGL
jgi:Bacterial SH3 domain